MWELRTENMPCWYELSWREEIPAIVLRVHKDFIQATEQILSNNPDIPFWDMMEKLRKDLGLSSFVFKFSENFGFDNAFQRIGEKYGFVEFLIRIPKIEQYTDETCPNCKGTGKNKDLGIECSFCNGKGKHLIFDWKSGYAVSASFTAFSLLSRPWSKKTSSTLPQLLTIQTNIKAEIDGAPLGGIYSLALCNWLRMVGQTNFPEVVEAMKNAYRQMYSLNRLSGYYFGATNNDGWLVIDCPGNACGIYPSDGFTRGKGCEFTCHNLDTSVQQITLIAGLAALHDRARKEISISL